MITVAQNLKSSSKKLESRTKKSCLKKLNPIFFIVAVTAIISFLFTKIKVKVLKIKINDGTNGSFTTFCLIDEIT